MPTIPLLRDILPGDPPRPPMSLSLLARELNVPVSRLTPLVQHGYLRSIDGNTVESPAPAALLWLRQWFQPVQAKPLFSAKDVAELLEIEERTVPGLAAAHDVPAVHDPAFGLAFSLWSVRRLLLAVLSDKAPIRFDRQALLWWLIGNPMSGLPDYSEALEQEIERINRLEEPAQSIRREAILNGWNDVKAMVSAPESAERLFRRL